MLYILTGSDVVKAKARAMKLADKSEVVRFGEGGEAFANVGSYLSARGLFAPKVSLILDRPFETEEGEALLAMFKDFAEADTLVVLIQPELNAEAKKKIPKNAVIERYDISYQSNEKTPQSVFALTDAFAAGDRKKPWILYRQMIEDGASAEEIHGTLAWQARAMVLASKTKTALDSGLKPFVYMKAKQAAARFKEGQADQLSRDLVTLYHQSRMGEGTLEDLLEVFLLRKN